MRSTDMTLAYRCRIFLVFIGVALIPLFALAPEGESSGRVGRFYIAIPKLMKKWNIPGGTLAVIKDGRLVLAEGYGLADREAKARAKPETLFRIASSSKPFTAVGILKLIQEGKIHLEDKAFAVLNDLSVFPGATPDPRLADITVRDLLRHSGGWDSSINGDPQFMSLEIASDTGLPSPSDTRTIIRYWMGKSMLQYDPGTNYVYSNFGYNILGRIIEKVTGQTYEDYINSVILIPMGIRRMHIGKTLREQRAEGEAAYYAQPGAALVDSVYPAMGKVQKAYGSWCHPDLDAHGGWIASAVDLVRFLRGVEGSGGVTPVLSEAMIQQMTAFQNLYDPHLDKNQDPDAYYGLGWNVLNPGTDQEQWNHAGALEQCCSSWIVHRADGISYAAIFNSLPEDYEGFFKELKSVIDSEVASVKHWPEGDLFPRYP